MLITTSKKPPIERPSALYLLILILPWSTSHQTNPNIAVAFSAAPAEVPPGLLQEVTNSNAGVQDLWQEVLRPTISSYLCTMLSTVLRYPIIFLPPFFCTQRHTLEDRKLVIQAILTICLTHQCRHPRGRTHSPPPSKCKQHLLLAIKQKLVTYKPLGVCHQPSASVCLRLATFLKFEGERPFGRSASPFSRDNVRFGVRFRFIESAIICFVVRFPYKTIKIVRCSCRLSPISSASIHFRPRKQRIYSVYKTKHPLCSWHSSIFKIDRAFKIEHPFQASLFSITRSIKIQVYTLFLFSSVRALYWTLLSSVNKIDHTYLGLISALQATSFPWSDARRELLSSLATFLPSTRRNISILSPISPSTRRNLYVLPIVSPSPWRCSSFYPQFFYSGNYTLSYIRFCHQLGKISTFYYRFRHQLGEISPFHRRFRHQLGNYFKFYHRFRPQLGEYPTFHPRFRHQLGKYPMFCHHFRHFFGLHETSYQLFCHQLGEISTFYHWLRH